jgi:hypothetical protein
MTTLDKRLTQLEAGKDRCPFYPLHIYRHGAARVPEKPYYIGKNGELPPMVVVHEVEVPG